MRCTSREIAGRVVLLGVLLAAMAASGCAGDGAFTPRVLPAFPATDCPTSGPPASVMQPPTHERIPGTYVLDGPRAEEIVTSCPGFTSFPPAVGPMAAAVANCGFYDAPIPPANAVRSLAAGAVWIAYDPSIDRRSLNTIRKAATSSPQMLASPMRGLPSPVVLTSWKRQLQLPSVEDPRFDSFIDEHLFSPDRQTMYATCYDGVGQPAASFWDAAGKGR